MQPGTPSPTHDTKRPGRRSLQTEDRQLVAFPVRKRACRYVALGIQRDVLLAVHLVGHRIGVDALRRLPTPQWAVAGLRVEGEEHAAGARRGVQAAAVGI